jgi:hypothetical protein
VDELIADRRAEAARDDIHPTAPQGTDMTGIPDGVAVTSDRTWANLDLGLTVHLIR